VEVPNLLEKYKGLAFSRLELVGLKVGGGQIIDASSSNGRVVQRSLGGWWQRNFIVGWRIF